MIFSESNTLFYWIYLAIINILGISHKSLSCCSSSCCSFSISKQIIIIPSCFSSGKIILSKISIILASSFISLIIIYSSSLKSLTIIYSFDLNRFIIFYFPSLKLFINISVFIPLNFSRVLKSTKIEIFRLIFG